MARGEEEARTAPRKPVLNVAQVSSVGVAASPPPSASLPKSMPRSELKERQESAASEAFRTTRLSGRRGRARGERLRVRGGRVGRGLKGLGRGVGRHAAAAAEA